MFSVYCVGLYTKDNFQFDAQYFLTLRAANKFIRKNISFWLENDIRPQFLGGDPLWIKGWKIK